MDDSIVDIDAALSDSFATSDLDESFDDVNAIVQQWKQSAEAGHSSGSDDRLLNTRTYTRPKRRNYAKCTPNLFAPSTHHHQHHQQQCQQPPASPINLQIGGLVTGGGNGTTSSSAAADTQHSFLGDISPPSSLCSNSTMLAAGDQLSGSLITSNDFSSLNYFNDSPSATAADDQQKLQRFEALFDTSRPKVFDEISMLNASYDVRTNDDTVIVGDNNDTFVADATFERTMAATSGNDIISDAHESLVDDTSLRNDERPLQNDEDVALNATYDNNTLTNRTLVVMDSRPPLNVTVDAIPSADVHVDVCANDQWTRSLENVGHQPVNDTLAMDEQRRMDHGHQSTPIKLPVNRNNTVLINETMSLANISPIALSIAAASSKFQTYVRPKQRHHDSSATPVDALFVRNNDKGRHDTQIITSPTTPTSATSAQRELDERQSLTNFEEFEKSLSQCQTDIDFDEMLNGLAVKSPHQRSNDAHMRQTLDHIKKRHSLLNLEKQHEDQLRRNAVSSATKPTAADSNRLLEKSMLSSTASTSVLSTSMLLSMSGCDNLSSSSSERLLRRSRVTDDIVPMAASMQSSSGSNTSSSISQSDSKENTAINVQPPSLAASTTGGHAAECVPVLKPRSIPNNRDRFKTIRLTKRSPELDDIAAASETTAVVDDETNAPMNETMNIVAGNHTDRLPQQQQQQHDASRSSSSLSIAGGGDSKLQRRRVFTRPSQLTIVVGGGQQMRQPDNVEDGTIGGGTIAISPMGIKSKSYQNLNVRMSEKSAIETNACSRKERSTGHQPNDPTFKIPTALPTAQRVRSLARPSGLMRPSSGCFGYGGRRNDSDTESGRMSPTNSLSSGSSKGSLYRADVGSSDSVAKSESVPPSGSRQSVQPKQRSGIQPPGAFVANRKRSGLPRPMSMANR